MIKLEVINAPNKDFIGEQVYFKNRISIGNQRNDINLELAETFFIELKTNTLKFENEKKPYLLNGKKALSARNLRKDDVITLGNVEFKVLEFMLETQKSSKDIFNEKFNSIVEEAGLKLDTLQAFQERLNNDNSP